MKCIVCEKNAERTAIRQDIEAAFCERHYCTEPEVRANCADAGHSVQHPRQCIFITVCLCY
ncbi:MAG: hypothetical protein J4400_01720 [Candidatus Aenigmarchaeota archaeon]|nr:hypothetical protein [Candidatus Aenigmarchaeota archaeon]